MSAVGPAPVQEGLNLPSFTLLQSAERLSDYCAPFAAVIALLVFGFWSWSACKVSRLQFDELLELSAASAPSSHDVLSYLASGVDYNPPLSHFLVRGSMSLFGHTELAARLPAFLGVSVLLVCLYVTIAGQLSPTYGLVAMLTILCLPVRDYAVQARPYGLVLGFSALLYVLHRAASQRQHRILALIGIALCSAALVATHYYAILVLGVPLAFELAAILDRRRPDWLLFACCSAPPLLVLFLLRDAMKQQRQQLTHYFAKGNLLSFDHGYDILAMDPLVYCVALLLIVGLISYRIAGGPSQLTYRARLTPAKLDLAWGAGLLLLPIVGALFTQFVTHAYVPRYFLPAAIGFAICLCYTADFWSGSIPGLAVVLLLPLSLGFGKAVLQESHRTPEALPSLEALTSNQLPLLFDTPGTYIQIAHYFPALRDTLWVITDPAVSMRYRHYDTDDKIMLALASHGEAQTITLKEAIRRWPHFRLVPRSGDSVWALKCLMNSGSDVRVLRPFGDSNFIFDVSVQTGEFAQIDACARP